MIELTLGALAAALVTKAIDRAEGKALDQSEGVLRRLVELVRGRLARDGEGSKALEQVEEVPDNPNRIEALARLLDEEATKSPEFGHELKTLVEQAKGAGVDVKAIAQVAYGDQSPQFTDVSNSEINVSYGVMHANRPRRIAE